MSVTKGDPARRRRGRLILVVGGASSGKSEVGLSLAGRATTRAFVATGQPLDDEMAERIRRHRQSRGPVWDTAEVPVDLEQWFRARGRLYRAIVLDCLTLWLSNLSERGVSDTRVLELVDELIRAIRTVPARVVVVTNELGMGLVPLEASARRFRDLAGQINQRVAQEADEVYAVLSGLPVRIKPQRGMRSLSRVP